jgi:hypothetical protein
MKATLAFFLMLPLLAFADGYYGQAQEYHFQGSNSYAVVFTTQVRAYVELRTYDGKVLESLDIYSPYMKPTFEVKDVVGDDRLEFLLITRSGGTGLASTSLHIITIANDHLIDVGRFIQDEHAASWPKTNWSHTVQGSVDFPKKDQVIYRSSEVVTQDGVSRTNVVVEVYQFDQTNLVLRKTEKAPTSVSILPK